MPASPTPVDVRDQLQTALGGAYTLTRELGGGGMSRVFVARENALGRDVVVKVLAPELAAGVSAERFAREIKLAAALQEPHIVPVHAAGVGPAGLPWYTMPLVEGESLRTRLARGPVPLAEAVAVLRNVAQALAYAHGRGIVHRDIKPENVLLSSGTGVVTDFGIAKALQRARTVAPEGPAAATHAGLTQRGTSLGTPAYMAPEQAAGDPATDHRADLYAWGVVAYEVLAGRHPFADRTTPQALMAAHFGVEPAPLPKAVPRPLAALVMRCLAKNSAERPASAGELLAGLDEAATAPAVPAATPARRRALAGAAAGVLLLAAAGGLAWRHAARADATGPEAATSDGAPRVAVLPFENAGPAEQAYVADGLTDEVRSRLSAVPGLTVIARASSNQYRAAAGQAAKPPQTVARELGVRFLLTGTVRSEPGVAGRPARVRVTPELVEVRGTGAPVSRWQQSLDADAADVFAMEADIAGRVASALDVALSAGTRARLAEVPTKNPAAYDAYLRGEAFAAPGGAVAQQRALEAYRQATTLDPTFAAAWAGRSQMASGLYMNGGVAAPAALPRLAAEARTAGGRARALAPDRPDGLLALALYALNVAQDPARGLALMTEARRRAPGDAQVLVAFATAERAVPGHWADGIRDLRAAAAQDPRAPGTAQLLAQGLFWARRYPEAQAAADHALALAPTNVNALNLRVYVALAQGDLAGARRVLAAAPPGVDRDALLARVTNDGMVPWVLDDADQRRVLALGPAAYGGDRALWAAAQMEVYRLRGDAARARAYADTAHQAFAAQLRSAPKDAYRWVEDADALAVLGRRAEAGAAAARSAALLPISRHAYIGPQVQHLRAMAYVRLGEPARALDELEPLLRAPYLLSPGWLRIDPTWAPLRDNPRFERLVAGQ